MTKKATYTWEGKTLTVKVEGTDESVVFNYDSYPEEIVLQTFRLGGKARAQSQINKSASPADVLASLVDLNASLSAGTWSTRGTKQPRLALATLVVAHVTGKPTAKVSEILHTAGLKGNATMVVAALADLKGVKFADALRTWKGLEEAAHKALAKAPSVVTRVAELKAAVANKSGDTDDVIDSFGV